MERLVTLVTLVTTLIMEGFLVTNLCSRLVTMGEVGDQSSRAPESMVENQRR